MAGRPVNRRAAAAGFSLPPADATLVRATGKSKPIIAKAIKTGRLAAVRAEDGSYQIDPSLPIRGQPTSLPQSSQPSAKNRAAALMRCPEPCLPFGGTSLGRAANWSRA
jgi:hypothetical protein